MSRRARIAVFAALCVPLLGAAIYLIAAGAPPPSGDQETASEAVSPSPSAQLHRSARARGALSDAVARAERRDRLATLARERVQQGIAREPGPGLATLELYANTQREAEPVARRFFAAYSLYELGRVDAGVSKAIEDTATAAFAGALLEAPPRPPLGGPLPERAELGRVELVPGRQSSSAERLSAIELVGQLRRGTERETFAIELEREASGGWLVAAVGR